MIAARIRIEGDDYDWFDDECEFPVLPPVGSQIHVIDKNSNLRELTVTGLQIQGVRAGVKARLPNTFGKQGTVILTRE